jgi:peptidoglycan/LPS O-acetylase OafA/YrhL
VHHTTAYRPHIDGIRALAVVLVILFHLGYPWMPDGFIGVDVFFVLSGYLITGLLLREVARRSAAKVEAMLESAGVRLPS